MNTTILDAIIIDDEMHSRGLLALLLEKHVPYVNVIAEGNSAQEARAILSEKKPKIVFLDIEMPNENGIDLLVDLQPFDFYPIMVTSFSEYTMSAIKAHAFDYLLKPVDPEELKKTLGAVRSHMMNALPIDKEDSHGFSRVELRSLKGNIYLDQEKIVSVQASGSYSEIVMVDEKHTVSKNLKVIEEQLDPRVFFRAHNSIIINISKVKEFIHEGNYVCFEDGSKYVVSTSKKNELLERLRKL